MKITHDPKIDALYIRLNETQTYCQTKKVTDNVLVDYDQDGHVIGIEVLAASENVILPSKRKPIIIEQV